MDAHRNDDELPSFVPGLPWKAGMAVGLAGVAGYVDAVGYLTLSQLFTAHMSGNSARLGVLLAHGRWGEAAVPAVAIGLFVLSIAIATAVMEAVGRYRWASTVILSVEALALAAYLGFGQATLQNGVIKEHTVSFWVLEVVAVFSMGLQTATLRRVSGRTVRTTYVSGMLTRLAEEIVNLAAWRLRPQRRKDTSYLLGELGLGPARDARRRLILITAIWLVYAVGAVGGGYLDLRWRLWCLAVPLAALVVVIIGDVTKM